MLPASWCKNSTKPEVFEGLAESPHKENTGIPAAFDFPLRRESTLNQFLPPKLKPNFDWLMATVNLPLTKSGSSSARRSNK